MSAVTRLAPLVRGGGGLFRGLRARLSGNGVRHAGGGVHIEPRYRQFPQLTRSQVIQAEFFSATMWFWILWRFWHDSDAVLEPGERSSRRYGLQFLWDIEVVK
ncbi:NADH dehydrogenase [ubiquinone] 1 beta subcomplex subunit 2, mitochondrial isoform X2 [Artibeus jamaicensis]|uniref:NADH dehydrogenase [ubiquinone] 1 beta subcomplex subunit 2, mitochondrial isoform X2 n=1 Tax=Artibeus jamaicensis TaxID=9417 RepID=UPI00187D09C2|nr:NADH dehydrogenase [ubiquinone] 1 beta subcomplex subunit 2, mitochondrial isoform X2 [Artibeus jamaicensis]